MRGRRGVQALVVTVVLGMALGAVIATRVTGRDREPVPTSSSPGALGPGPTLGVQVFAMWRDWENRDELMAKVRASGARWIRVDVGWCSLEENGPGAISTWYQDRLDAVVAAAARYQLSLLVTLTCSPTWARADGRTRALPDDPEQYGRVARYLAGRYAGRIAAWELWNEPDCLDLGCGRGDPVEYVPVLRAGYLGIKAGDPDAVAISGGTSGINLAWVGKMLEAGAGDYMDALAVNPYLAPAYDPPEVPPTKGGTDPYRITNAKAMHDLLTEAGYPSMPMWFTEFGWSTGRTPGSVYDGVSEATQADFMSRTVALVRERYPFVTRAFWFTLRDRDDASEHENGYGMLNLDGSPKPSYATFTRLNQSRPARGAHPSRVGDARSDNP